MSTQVSQNFFISILKAVVLSLLISLTTLLLFAIIVKTAYLGSNAIKSVNQFIKIISIFIGCFFTISGNLGIVKGLICGAVYSLCIYSIFAIIGWSQIFAGFYLDCIFTAIVGGISGIIAVNRK